MGCERLRVAPTVLPAPPGAACWVQPAVRVSQQYCTGTDTAYVCAFAGLGGRWGARDGKAGNKQCRMPQ